MREVRRLVAPFSKSVDLKSLGFPQETEYAWSMIEGAPTRMQCISSIERAAMLISPVCAAPTLEELAHWYHHPDQPNHHTRTPRLLATVLNCIRDTGLLHVHHDTQVIT